MLNHDSITVWNQHRDWPPLWLGAWSWLVDSGAIPAITPSAEPLCQLPFLRALPSSEPSLPDRKSPNPPDQCERGTLLGPLYRCVSHSVPGCPAPYRLSRRLPDILQVLVQVLTHLGSLSRQPPPCFLSPPPLIGGRSLLCSSPWTVPCPRTPPPGRKLLKVRILVLIILVSAVSGPGPGTPGYPNECYFILTADLAITLILTAWPHSQGTNVGMSGKRGESRKASMRKRCLGRVLKDE